MDMELTFISHSFSKARGNGSMVLTGWGTEARDPRGLTQARTHSSLSGSFLRNLHTGCPSAHPALLRACLVEKVLACFCPSALRPLSSKTPSIIIISSSSSGFLPLPL